MIENGVSAIRKSYAFKLFMQIFIEPPRYFEF